MKGYANYRENASEWLPEIPAHWPTKKMKFVARLRSGYSITSNQISNEGVYPVYGGNGLRGYTNSYTHEGEHVLIGRQGALCGNVNYARGKFWASEHAVVATMNGDENVHWFGELLRSMNLNQYSLSAAQPGLAVERVVNLNIPCPPIEEQNGIASFLEAKTNRIDTLIQKKRKMIELLKEERQAIINQAVTKGINPDAEMKDSGVEWLGEVPKHWEVKKLKHIAFAQNSNVDKKSLPNEQKVRLCNYTDVYYNDIIAPGLDFMEATATLDEIERFALKVGDVIITKDSEMCNDIAIPAYVEETDNDLLCGYHLTQITPKPSILNGKFLFYLFMSKMVRMQFEVEATGITRYGISKYSIDNSMLPLPPLKEQNEIVNLIDSRTALIDSAIQKTDKDIPLLEEYRTALINEAVTGKIDVRENV